MSYEQKTMAESSLGRLISLFPEKTGAGSNDVGIVKGTPVLSDIVK